MSYKVKRFIIWWRRQGIPLRLFLTSVLGLVFVLLLYLQRPGEDLTQVTNNLLVFFLVNLMIVVLCILAFLIGRNIVKLVFDRKRNILGSKLRMRLVLAFVGLTLVPTGIIFFLASGLLSSAMEGWFGGPIESVYSSSIEVAKEYNSLLKQEVEKAVPELERKVKQQPSIKELGAFFENYRESQKLFSIQLATPELETILRAESATAVISNFREPELEKNIVERALENQGILTAGEEKDSSQFIRSYKPVNYDGKKLILVVSRRVNPELSHALNNINEAYKEFEQIQLFRGPLKSAYFLTLAMITGLILFSAIWFGFYMAKELSGPIQRLAEGTRAVAKGNYDFRIRELGDDEMAYLIRSFNSMTADIKDSKEEAEKRRGYIETILANLAVGVIALDTEEKITIINPTAASIYEIPDPASAIGKPVGEVLRPVVYDALFRRMTDETKELELVLKRPAGDIKILCTIGSVYDSHEKLLAKVLIFDDITELVKAQHMAAWREVARRIAHEIKNPLTPIQLSAQRLQKLFSERGTPAVFESTNTILENVDSIKRLANEFSNFARMPSAEFLDCDFNNLVSAGIAPFAENHTDIIFHFIADNKLPTVKADAEQIRRVVMNIVDNSVAAILSETPSEDSGRITIRTAYHQDAEEVLLEVSDNGPGIPTQDKQRIFDPYYTTKPSGTGLGLAIVSTIVSDHQGKIELLDNYPKGARFLVTLPIAPQVSTQRKFAN